LRLAAPQPHDSGMLSPVRKAALLATYLAAAAALAAFARDGASRSRGKQAPSTQQQQAQQAQPAPPAQPPVRKLEAVVLDPAHGGTDEGAHGTGGIVEKDTCLALAEAVEGRLSQDGLKVLMTREDDETVSFDQRAAIANAQPNAIFVSLHVGSTGPVGTAIAYYYDFSLVAEPPGARAAPAGELVPWSQAQRASVGLSRRLAQLVQVELSQRLAGSPELPASAPVYQLRAIGEPAIAIELASVNAENRSALDARAAPLAEALSRAIAAFQRVYEAPR
jgi:N-acetylmuramoyl-L-alanine amidase